MFDDGKLTAVPCHIELPPSPAHCGHTDQPKGIAAHA